MASHYLFNKYFLSSLCICFIVLFVKLHDLQSLSMTLLCHLVMTSLPSPYVPGNTTAVANLTVKEW